MSAVWRAVDEGRRTSVAVKLVPLDLAPNFDLQTLARLIRVSAQPGLVTLLDHGREGPWWYQVAEWVNGETLESWCRKTAVHSSGQIAEFPVLMKEIACALSAYHRAGFVHGDVKPSNVLLVDGHARLIDLVGVPIGARWNRYGGLTPAFATPESLNGAPAHPRDDIHSFAAMVVHLAGGRPLDPLQAPDGSRQPPLLMPSQWRALLDALDPVRGRRFETVTALVSEVWRVSPGEPKSAAPPVVPRAPARIPERLDPPPRPRRHTDARWGMAAAAAAAAALLLSRQAGQLELAVPAVAIPASSSSIANPDIAPILSETVAPIPSQAPHFTKAKLDGATARSNFRRARVRESRPTPASLEVTRDTTPLPTQVEVTEAVHPAKQMAMPAASAPAPEEVTRGLAGRPRPELVAIRAVAFFPERAARSTGENPRIAPDVPIRPETPVEPTTPERPDLPPTSRRPDVPAVPEVPEVVVVPERPNIPSIPERPEVVVVIERPNLPVIPERPDKPDKPERPDVAVVIERPNLPVIPERPDKPDRPERPDKPDKPDRPEVALVIERPILPVIPERPDKPERPDRPDKPGRPDRPDRPDKPDRG